MKLKITKTKPKINANYVDAFENQLKELYIIENPKYSNNKNTAYSSSDFKKFKNKHKNNFKYVYYPWNNHVVKTINKNYYYTLKTNRNRNLIDSELQEKLKDYKIAVLGMSVGSNIAFVLTQAGVSEEITIADFDELDTTNLNRIWGGAHQIGLEKVQVAARRIWEDNPFAKVTIWNKGVNEKLLENALKEGKVNCIVEEVDAMPVKLMVRQLAFKYKVPVIMVADNGDGIVLTSERYDLDYDKFMEKPFKYWPKKMESCKSPQDFADIVINDMVGGVDKVDKRMMESVEMIFKGKLVSWPQLGSAALLAGVAATIEIKDIVRGKTKKKFVRKNIFI